MNKKKKQTIAAIAATALLVTGTYAWQAFDQIVRNESAGFDADQGTRLHNYFDGSNVDVFVENYSTVESGVQAYTRVKILEYMEIGEGAGALDGSNSSATLVRGDVQNYITPSITDKTTWDTYLHQDNDGATSGEIRDYLTLNYGDEKNANGGSTVYMPTFNKDFDNDTAEINGTLLGSGSDRFDSSTHYDDYVSYTVGESITKMAIYSPDALIVQQEGTTEIEETHIAASTMSGSVITMDEWLKDQKSGDFWVYDTDGWAYWANGIAPETATSLLIDSISKTKTPDADWYYGLHVINDSATADAWLEQIMMDGGQPISDNAILLLSEMGIEVPGLEVSGVTILTPAGGIPTDAYTQTTVGGSIVLNSEVNNNYGDDKYQDLNWYIEEVSTASFLVDLLTSGNASGLTDEQIDATIVDGIFTPVEGMEGYSYLVTAESKVDTSKTATVVLSVIDTSSAASITVTSVGIRTANGNALSDSDKELYFGENLSLNATVYTDQAADEYQNVTWSISSTATNIPQANLDATLVAGTFTPIIEMEGNKYTIKATSVFDPSKSSSVSVTVKQSIETEKEEIEQELGKPLEIEKVYIRNSVGNIPTNSQKTTTVGSNISLQQEVVTNVGTDEYQDVNWTINATSGSALSAVVKASLVEGIFTPVESMEGGTYDVMATSKYDSSKYDTVTLTVEEIPSGVTYAVESVSITTTTAGLPSTSYKQTVIGSSIELSATVYTTVGYKEYQDMTWSIVEKGQSTSTAAINATMVNGVFTPVSSMAGKTYTVTARSKEDLSKSDSVDLIVIDTSSTTGYELYSLVVNKKDGERFTVYDSRITVGDSLKLGALVEASDTRDAQLKWTVEEYITDENQAAGNYSKLTAAQIQACINDGEFTPIAGMKGFTFTITVTSALDKNTGEDIISDSVTVTVSNMTQEEVDASTIEIGLFGSKFSLETEQGGFVGFSAGVTGLETSYLNWHLEGNDSPNTKVDYWSTMSSNRGGLWIGADETVGNVLKVTASSMIQSTVVSNTIEVEVVAVDEDKVVVEIQGATGTAVVGTESSINMDGIDYYVLAVKDTNNDGKDDQALLWATDTVELPESVRQVVGTTNNGYHGTQFYKLDTTETFWATSYIRTTVIPEWLKTMPTVVEKAIPTKLVTDGYYSGSTSVASGDREDEGTTDSVFILSQPEFLEYVGLGDSRAYVTTSPWLRSAHSDSRVKVIHTTGTGFNYNSSSAFRGGVQPAFWVALD